MRERSPKLCSDELSFVQIHSINSRPAIVASNYGQLGIDAGLTEVHLIRSVADARDALQRADLPRNHHQALGELTDENFATGHVYALTEFGLSEWTLESEFEEWQALRDDILNPRRVSRDQASYHTRPRAGFDLKARVGTPMRALLEILSGQSAIPGIEDEFLMDLRESYAFAVSVADTITDRRALSEEWRRLKLKDLHGAGPELAFEMLYDRKLRLFAKTHKLKHPIELPFSFVDDKYLNVTDASARLVLQMIVRRPLLARLKTVDLQHLALNENQLMTGALFPELVPMLIMAPKKTQNASMASWIEPDDNLLNSYNLRVGPTGAFEFSTAWPKMLGPKLNEMGFDSVAGMTLILQRRENQYSEPGALDAIIEVAVNEVNGPAPTQWMRSEIAEIGRALAVVLSDFKGFDDVKHFLLRPDVRPYERGTGVLRVELVSANPQAYVHLFEIASEFDRYEAEKRP